MMKFGLFLLRKVLLERRTLEQILQEGFHCSLVEENFILIDRNVDRQIAQSSLFVAARAKLQRCEHARTLSEEIVTKLMFINKSYNHFPFPVLIDRF